MHNLVALVGRPNVGKSTLFNRLLGRRQAIDHDTPGVTRDRHYDLASWTGHSFTLVDTGGYVPHGAAHFEKQIRQQVAIALQEAQLVLFVVDSKEGLTPVDHHIAQVLRKTSTPILVVANKADNPERHLAAHGFHELGLGPVYIVAATHGQGTGDLLDAIVGRLGPQAEPTTQPPYPRFSLIGRPNVGKSTFCNALLQQERSIVTDQPHTTRDAIDTPYHFYGMRLLLTDTAGVYKKRKTQEALQLYAMLRSLKALQRSEVCLLLIDAAAGLTTQDKSLLQFAQRAKKGLVLLVNKWDTLDKDTHTHASYQRALHQQLGSLQHVPIVFTSGLHKQRIYQAIRQAWQVYHNRSRRVPTGLLNQLMTAEGMLPPPLVQGKRLRINYVTQLPTPTPTFAFFCNRPQYVPPAYQRYLEKRLRQHFEFAGVPLTLVFRKK